VIESLETGMFQALDHHPPKKRKIGPMRFKIFVILAVILLASPVAGQQDFREYVESQKEHYSRFLKQEDREFHRFLQKEWKEFRMMSGRQEDPEPKPDRVPEAPLPGEKEEPAPSVPETEGREGEQEESPVTSLEVPPVQPSADPSLSPSEQPSTADSASVDFFGHDLEFRFDPAWREIAPKGEGKQRIRSFWKQFARLDSKPILKQLRRYGHELNLGDWGRLLLTEGFARRVASGSGARADLVPLLSWGWLLKSGRDVRVARSGEQIILLYRCRHEVFQVPYFTLQGSRYYVFGQANPAQVSTYQGDYQGAQKALDLNRTTSLGVQGAQVQQSLEFQFRDRTYEVKLSLPKARIRFLDTVPQLPLRLYFHARPGKVVTKSLVRQLREAVSPMGQQEAVNFLLRFMQKAFRYEKDTEQFGEENYLYPEETLFYPASDCEDRTILFSVLVRRVLGLEVAVLDYPGHVATALDMSLSGEGAQVHFNGRALVVADPTYINARLGMIMPDFAKERPRILPLWKASQDGPQG
jgi:hypothetical protein